MLEFLKSLRRKGRSSKNFDAASGVAEFSSQEKVSKSLKTVAEKKEECSESEKMTLVETFKGFDAAFGISQVSTEDEKSSIATETVEEKKDDSLEGERPRSVETSNDLNVAANISGGSLGEEKTSGGGGTGMAQEKKDEGEKCPESTETINEKKSEVSENARKTLGETFKEHDLEEKNVTALRDGSLREGDASSVAGWLQTSHVLDHRGCGTVCSSSLPRSLYVGFGKEV